LSLNSLAVLYDAQGRYADAEPLYRRAFTLTEKALGPEHPDTGTAHSRRPNMYNSEVYTSLQYWYFEVKSNFPESALDNDIDGI